VNNCAQRDGPLNWVYPFSCDILSSGAYIASKQLNHDPELFKTFCKMSIACSSLLAERTGPQERRKDTNFRTDVSADEKLLINLG